MLTKLITAITPYLLIGTITFLVFNNSLSCDFTFDDTSAIILNRHVHTNATIWWKLFQVDYWGTPIKSEHSHKSYRPITSLTFRFNYFFSELNPYGYHLTNVLLHIFVTFLCYKFIIVVLGYENVWPAILFTIFFACHPLKSEAVTSIVGRAELLSTLFILISLFCYLKLAYLSFGFFIILATLSKEQGMTIPCICMIVEIIKLNLHYQLMLKDYNSTFKSRLFSTICTKIFVRLLILILFTISLVSLRFFIMGYTFPIFTKFDNPASFEDSPVRQLTYNYLLYLNSKLMIYPQYLCADWTMNSIPLVKDYHDPRNICTAIFYLITFLLFLRALYPLVFGHSSKVYDHLYSDNGKLLMALVLIIVPFLPASNLLFPVGFVIAERVLYTPSIGYLLLLTIGWKRIRDYLPFKFVSV